MDGVRELFRNVNTLHHEPGRKGVQGVLVADTSTYFAMDGSLAVVALSHRKLRVYTLPTRLLYFSRESI
jgi:hypothetical protein